MTHVYSPSKMKTTPQCNQAGTRLVDRDRVCTTVPHAAYHALG